MKIFLKDISYFPDFLNNIAKSNFIMMTTLLKMKSVINK